VVIGLQVLNKGLQFFYTWFIIFKRNFIDCHGKHGINFKFSCFSGKKTSLFLILIELINKSFFHPLASSKGEFNFI